MEGPEPRRIQTLAELSLELELLRARAAPGSRKTKVSLAELAKRVGEPRSTIHSYVTGRYLAPPEVLDRMVAALGATPAELREWGEAWFRVSADLEVRKHPSETVPRELPADVPAFTGRAVELAALDRLLDDSGRDTRAVVLSAVAGMAGVGKTALAVHWGRAVTDAFPDGSLYIDLRGYDPDEPVRPGDALARFLRTLGPHGADIPYDPAERAARYRTLLDGRRMLIILDNARNTEQVRPLLPGAASCFVIVTSRDRLSGLVSRHGARRIDLDLLPATDATALLRRLVGRRIDADPASADRLAAYCARLPLALRVAAESAVARPGMALASLAGELADEHRRLELLQAGDDPRTAIRTVFSWSYDHLPAQAARMFRLLGLHPGTAITVTAAARLCATGATEAERMLDTLADAHLVQPTRHGYRMHDLVRAWARERATTGEAETDRRAALTRLLDYYLHTAAVAVKLLYPHERSPQLAITAPVPVADEPTARHWLATERANLAAITVHAARHGWPRHAIQLSAVLHRHLYLAADFTTAQTLHEHALAAARRHGAPEEQARALHDLGSTLASVAEYDQAVDLLERALALHREAGDRAREARALSNLGTTYWRSARYDRAATHLERAVAIYHDVNDPAGEVRARLNLAATFWRSGRYPRAVDHLHWVLALSDRLGIREGQVLALGGLGAVGWRQGRYAEAVALLSRACVLAVEAGDRFGESIARMQLGAARGRTGAHDEAVEHLERAVTLWRESGDRDGHADALTNLGDVHNLAGRHETAATCHYEALRLFRACGDRTGLAMAWNGLGETASATAAPARALGAHEQARTFAVEADDLVQLARAHHGTGHVHLALGDVAGCRTQWRLAVALYDEQGAPEAERIRGAMP
ncbi:ATP-binding protein [Actinophytocola oryzae]|uniref:Tetratricopeptide repeat protein n=1 Tax=Actinophytocola oryzae TaxID=502181 RepID=A0A4R7VRG7_9PSEU|nr:helix-turn-helix domain-containing protein [Actinophytocola oryzae]TDV52314.1 tetratricopeptide repeat protein [Actinophytocola oryzae]